MDNMIIDLVKYRMEKAKNDLEASKILLENKLFAQSLNRSYYSIFHSDAEQQIENAEKFIKTMEEYILKMINKIYIYK